MPAIIGSAHYMDALRARDGVNWAVFTILQGYPADPSTGLYPPLITWGPGATPNVPGTRLYWIDSLSGVYVTEGTVVGFVPGTPNTGTSVTIFWDQITDSIYYIRSDGAANLVADRFDGAAWTTLGQVMTAAEAAGFGYIAQIPSTALNGANQIAVCGYAVVSRWDGAAWVVDFTQPNGFIGGIAIAPLPTTGEFVLCCNCNRGIPSGLDPVIQLRSASGVWADITPVQWQPPAQNTERTCWCACEYNGELYAVFSSDRPTVPGAARREIWKRTAAGVWSLELDLAAELPPDGIVTSMTVIDDVLYCGMDRDYLGGDFLTKDSGGWHHNQLPADIQGPGTTGTIQTFLLSPEGRITPNQGNCSGEYVDAIAVYGFWDSQQFVDWAVDTLWDRATGVWQALSTSSVGTQVWIGPQFLPTTAPVGNGIGGDGFVGEIDVLDPFVLTGSPSNGKGFGNVQVNNSLAPGHGLLGDADYPLYLPDGYEHVCPAIASVDPSHGDLNGGYTVTLHGTNFFSNQITPALAANQVFVMNRIQVRTASGKFVEVDRSQITFVDTETITFPMPPYPGGTDPVVDVRFRPAGLAPFNRGVPVGIFPYYRCDIVSVEFTYDGVDFAVLGSLETVLGLGGTGGDVVGPGGIPTPGGALRCPTDVVAGPCIR